MRSQRYARRKKRAITEARQFAASLKIQAQWRGSAAAGTGTRPVPEPEPEPEGKGEVVPVPERSPAAGRFQVGDKVQRRDGIEAWGIGHVTQLKPLKVNMSAADPSEDGFAWDEVRPFEPSGQAAGAGASGRATYCGCKKT